MTCQLRVTGHKLYIAVILAFLISFLAAEPTTNAMPLEGPWRYYDGIVNTHTTNPVWLSRSIKSGFAGWSIVNYPDRPELDPNRTDVWITTYIPVHDIRHPTLLFYTVNQAVQVYVGQHLLYQAGDINRPEDNIGSRWHVIDLPRGSSGQALTFHLYSDNHAYLGRIDSPILDTAINQTYTIISRDLSILLALPIDLLLLLLTLFFFYRNRQGVFLLVSLLLLLFAVWLVSISSIRQIYSDNPMFWRYMMLISLYLMPSIGNLMVREIIDQEYRRRVLYLAYVFIILFACSIFSESMGTHFMEHNLPIYYALLVMSQMYVLFLVIKSATNGNRLCFALSPMALWMPLLGAIDGLGMHLHFRQFSSYTFPLSIVFLAFFVLRLIQLNMAADVGVSVHDKALAEHKEQFDPVTKCYNCNMLRPALASHIHETHTTKKPLALMMIDIDFFKKINDVYGHSIGDRVLIGIAETIKDLLNDDHTLVRYGGEEFVLLCRNHDQSQAERLAKEILAAIANADLVPAANIACSIGITFLREGFDTSSNIMKRADTALYSAKRNGRNTYRVEL